jgi:hypothetical protein
MLTRQAWYVRFDPHPAGTNCFDRHQSNSAICSQSYENSTVFLMSLGQFLIAAFVFNKGAPFRRPIYTNIWLLLGEPAKLIAGGQGRGSGSGAACTCRGTLCCARCCRLPARQPHLAS